MRLKQPRDGYRYNSDTLMLYDYIWQFGRGAGFGGAGNSRGNSCGGAEISADLNARGSAKTRGAEISPLRGRVLDVGCGCGVLGLLIARDFSGVRLSMIDIQALNCALAFQNARQNGIDCEIFCGDFCAPLEKWTKFSGANLAGFGASDLEISANFSGEISKFDGFGAEISQISNGNSKNLDAEISSEISQISNEISPNKNQKISVPNAQKFDFIISNPPYYDPQILQSEHPHKRISRYASALPLEGFVAQARRLLTPRGHLIFCYEASQIAAICAALAANHLNLIALKFVYPNREKPANLVICHARAGVRTKTKIHQSVAVNEKNCYNTQTMEIFARANLESVDS